MKVLPVLLIVTLFLNGWSFYNKVQVQARLDIWDYDYSLAKSVHYHITNDSLVIIEVDAISADEENVVVRRKLETDEKQILPNVLSGFPFAEMLCEYKNPLVQDGDQKRFEITYDGKNKVIDVANVYNAQIAELVKVANVLVPKSYQIHYKSK